ncbi:Fic family protein [Pedobacter sp. SD-b]|uniref:Fic family protein n=1 Tax=Pedobacter segetis TaxID=2793069 RepID=A0ABS1BG94_9SPHI|nr:DUF4172 domain-containing protein [Pedobacter segetis]MBK0381889.1 Fic family protein [Pedobacter segetis]
MDYNWQRENWPNFTYSTVDIKAISIAFAQELGLLNGLLLGLNEGFKKESLLELLKEEAIKTSEIEGEFMSKDDVMSSIKNNLGIKPSKIVKDKRANGVANLMVEVSQIENKTLTKKLICDWHKVLLSHDKSINTGAWRKGAEPMRIISGSYGEEKVHFEAPPSTNVAAEMKDFFNFFNNGVIKVEDIISKALIKAAIVHLYFETIHPFEDGNGRIGRALADAALSQTLKQPVLISLSKTIDKNKKLYYAQLKNAQKSLDVTEWVNYFTRVLLDALKNAKNVIEFTLKKSMFFEKFKQQLNARQLKVINKMMEKGSEGFEGGMTAKKYISITKTSKATATRDLQMLQEIDVLKQEGAGRSISYQLKI